MKFPTWRNQDSISNEVLDEIFAVARSSKTPEQRLAEIMVLAADQSNPSHMRVRESMLPILASVSLLCKVRAFLTKEPVPFSTINEFQETPEVEIGRLFQHLELAERNNQTRVTVLAHDLRKALTKITMDYFRAL
jgi:hypothetical protein